MVAHRIFFSIAEPWQAAEKLSVARDFGWRSGSPLR
jgi:hypothetical protein